MTFLNSRDSDTPPSIDDVVAVCVAPAPSQAEKTTYDTRIYCGLSVSDERVAPFVSQLSRSVHVDHVGGRWYYKSSPTVSVVVFPRGENHYFIQHQYIK